jgi:hypothetical protein
VLISVARRPHSKSAHVSALACLALLAPVAGLAGGPKYVAGVSFFNPGAVGQPAQVTSISPNEITAIALPAANGVTGSVDVEVDDLPTFSAAAIISSGVSFNSGTGDALTLNAAFGTRPEYAPLQAVTGTSQSLSLQGTPALVTLRLLDIDGNPMAGGSVSLYQALYAWAPPCASHSVCAPSPLLAKQTTTATSALDGTVTFAPASLPGAATNLQALAASGNTSTVSIAIEQHP